MVVCRMGLDIGSENFARMDAWNPPGHWPKAARDAHMKSMRFLDSIAEGSDAMTLALDQQGLPRVVIRGTSRRWYRVGLHAHYVEDYVEVEGQYREVKEVHWRTSIDAGPWKQDIVERTPFMVSLCMHPTQRSRHLPIGDQIAALALALQNDKTTAMRIPLLAQSIVSPRHALENVYQFSEDGVIMHDEVYDEDDETAYMYDEYEDLTEQLQEDELWSLSELFSPEPFENEATQIEHRQLDNWMDQQELQATSGPTPWHHDDNQVWQLEDNLRKGRR